ncbi:MAG: ribosome silencing factor [Cellvibrionaceae bacterium]|nr:ribosome silencing factor [Cellvibrionaceae bacterium]
MPEQLSLPEIVTHALEDLKGQDLVKLNVKDLTDVMDVLIIATGTSNRHVKSLAENVVEEAKSHSIRPIGVEGKDTGEWVLVDFGEVVVHLMLQATRDFYELEKLWSTEPSTRHKQS